MQAQQTGGTDHEKHAGEHAHVHAPGCGHETRRHDDHDDYEHGGHWHAKHGDHYDDHDAMKGEAPS